MAKDPIKKANNGTYYFRANLGYDAVTGKQIQKYRSGFSTKKEARAEYSKLILAAEEGLAMEKLEHFLELGGTKKRYHTARDLRHRADRQHF